MRKRGRIAYRLSRRADNDFEQVYFEGLDRFGKAQADAYVRDLTGVFELIGDNPRMARFRYEIEPPVRVHPHRSHLIVYEEDSAFVVILRIRHARENWAEAPV
jgi:toxin ParE1/3/4